MTRLMKAMLITVISVAALAVSLDAAAQRYRGGGGGGHYAYRGGGGGGGHYAYRGGGGGHYAYRGHGHGHSHTRVGVSFAFGGPLWYGWPGYYPSYYYAPYYYPSYYYSPYYYPYPAAAYGAAPVYVERDRNDVAAGSPYWYYCRESNTYYPYVRECAAGWERVPAEPVR